MVSMPDWFAKTKEMLAADTWFSLDNAGSEAGLIQRYEDALDRISNTPNDEYPKHAAALAGNSWATASVDQHFVGDWIHYRYYVDRAVYGGLGGDFWPVIPSSEVIQKLRAGIQIAIHKALGDSELARLGIVSPRYLKHIWGPEMANGVDTNGVRPLAMSWNCVAPAGSDYFQVAALRGPSVVEFAIATPKPYGNSSMMRAAIRIIDNDYVYDSLSDTEEGAESDPEPDSLR